MPTKHNNDEETQPPGFGPEPPAGPRGGEADAFPPTLPLSTSRRIWGQDDMAFQEPAYAQPGASELRAATLARDRMQCRFCGFEFDGNAIHNVNDNHNDLSPDNLWTADVLCHGWQHLGLLAPDDGVIAFLPGLSGQDVNHLQRTIMVALQADEAQLRKDATALLNWMGSHRDYTKQTWGSWSPAVFADALSGQTEATRHLREVALSDLALVYHPVVFKEQAIGWRAGPYAAYPYARWPAVYHAIMHSPI